MLTIEIASSGFAPFQNFQIHMIELFGFAAGSSDVEIFLLRGKWVQNERFRLKHKTNNDNSKLIEINKHINLTGRDN